MSFLDLNSQCFCGLGKKIKFCCKDIYSDLDKIARAIDGKQYEAANRHIDRVLETHPHRPSVWSLRIQLLIQIEGEPDHVLQASDDFLAACPNNPIALSLSAVLSLAVKGQAASLQSPEEQEEFLMEIVTKLHRALDECKSHLPSRVADALAAIGQLLIESGHIMPGIEHLRFQLTKTGQANRSTQMLLAICQDQSVPLLLKLSLPFPPPVDWVNWKEGYIAARESAHRGAWSLVADQIEALIEEHEPHETLLRAHAVARCHLPQPARAANALRAVAEHRGVSTDDAIEAWVLARLLDPSDDEIVDVVEVEVPVENAEQLLETLQSDRRADVSTGDMSRYGGAEGPPPKAVASLADRPQPTDWDEVSGVDVPLLFAEATLHGKQTDREARLSIIVPRDELDRVNEMLKQWGLPPSDPTGELQILRRIPTVERHLALRPRLPVSLNAERRAELLSELRRFLMLERFPKQAQPALDGKTLLEAAQDPDEKRRLAALLFETESLAGDSAELIGELREMLGVPVSPLGKDVWNDIELVPLVRMHRVDPQSANDVSLLQAFNRAYQHGASSAVCRFGEELVTRDVEDKDEVYGRMAGHTLDSGKSIDLLIEAQRTAKSEGGNPGIWMVSEFHLRMLRGESAVAQRLLNELQTQYLDDPLVSQSLLRVLQRLGLVGPDGQSLQPSQPAAPEPSASDAVWTPDSPTADAAAGESNAEGKSKLWVPGMD